MVCVGFVWGTKVRLQVDPDGDDFSWAGAALGGLIAGGIALAIALDDDGKVSKKEGLVIMAVTDGGFVVGGFANGIVGAFKNTSVGSGSNDWGKGGIQNFNQIITYIQTVKYIESWIAERDGTGILTGAGMIRVTDVLKIITQYHSETLGLVDIHEHQINTSIIINSQGVRSATIVDYASGVGGVSSSRGSYPLNLVSNKLKGYADEAELYRKEHGGRSRVQVAAGYQDGMTKIVASALGSLTLAGKFSKGKLIGTSVGTNFMDSWINPEEVRLDIENLPFYFKFFEKF